MEGDGIPIKAVGVRFEPEFLDLSGERLSEQDFGLFKDEIGPYLDVVPDKNNLFNKGYVLCTVKDISGNDTTFGFLGFSAGGYEGPSEVYIRSYHCFMNWNRTGVDN